MIILDKEVLEWTEINGKPYPKKVRYTVDELPEISKDPTTNLIIESKHNITGRGLVFVIDLRKNSLEHKPPKVGDKVTIQDKDYRVTGTEMQRIMDNKISSLMGLNVIEL